MDDLRPDAELLSAPDGDAFGEAYRRHERRIVAYFRQRVHNAELAADLTAETLAAALLSRRGYRAAQGPAVAWLYGIARHILLMSARRGRVEDRARRRLAMPPLDLTDDVIERIDALARDPVSALDDLPPDQRRAVEARVLEGRSYVQIGRELQCSEAVVRKRVSRGLQSLRGRVEES
jgi:RNA polymerase sigma-70 factor, ECF subfamily